MAALGAEYYQEHRVAHVLYRAAMCALTKNVNQRYQPLFILANWTIDCRKVSGSLRAPYMGYSIDPDHHNIRYEMWGIWKISRGIIMGIAFG
jgi:hypothetical protein